jgi:hypothetical protein
MDRYNSAGANPTKNSRSITRSFAWWVSWLDLYLTAKPVFIKIGKFLSIVYFLISWHAGVVSLPPGVNFTIILWAPFAPKSFCQKITNPNCKHIKAAQNLSYKKATHKILVKSTPGDGIFP